MKTTVIMFLSVFLVASAIKTHSQEISGVQPDPKASVAKSNVSPTKDAYNTKTGGGLPYERMELKGVEGTIYIGDEWPSGTVMLRDGKKIEDYMLRYDILADQMQFISDKDTLAFASPKEISSVSFGGHTFIYETFQCENTIRQGYFEIIEPGSNKLLLKRLVTYELPDAANPDDKDATRYFIDECYFISSPGKLASKVMCNRKSVLTLLNEHNDEIEEYLKVTGNKVKTADDLRKVVAYYNALEENK